MRAVLSGLWLLMVLVGHVVLRTSHLALGPVPAGYEMVFFFGLGLPPMLLAGRSVNLQGRRQELVPCLRSPVFILGMIAIAMNFMSCGGDGGQLQGLLTVFTAQSLWLSWPAYWLVTHDPQRG